MPESTKCRHCGCNKKFWGVVKCQEFSDRKHEMEPGDIRRLEKAAFAQAIKNSPKWMVEREAEKQRIRAAHDASLLSSDAPKPPSIPSEAKTCPDVSVDGPCTTCGKPFDEHTHIFHGEDLCPGGEGVYTCKDCPHDGKSADRAHDKLKADHICTSCGHKAYLHGLNGNCPRWAREGEGVYTCKDCPHE